MNIKKMQVAVMNAKRNVTIIEKEIPTIKEDEVLIKIKVVGVCGSDMHYYTHGKIGDLEVETPFILGHEVAGSIERVGENVADLKVGDRVAVEAGLPCGDCELCRDGNYNLCKDMSFLATPPVDGAFCEYIAYPSKWVYKLPDSISYAEGALIEPLAVGLNAAQIADANIGETAFVFGCGCIGLMTLLALRSRGVSQIYMCDVIPDRLEKAKALGATDVFDSKEVDVIKKIHELTFGRGVDCVFEMTGAEMPIKQTVDVVKTGGKIVLVGLGSDMNVSLDLGKLIWKEAQIRTCFRYENIYLKAIRAIESKNIDVKPIISHTQSFENLSDALEYHVENINEIIKMIIEFK